MGGEKAGSRQAEGIFAFLLDRGERGAGKDEIIELVWPDVDLDRADVAFHRTMLGLRSMLQPGRRRREGTAAIVFHNDRYRLDAGVIAWSDVAEFERLLAEARGATPVAGIQALEQARRLYRGDYLDDCPFYGDSADVEDRRVACVAGTSTCWSSSASATPSAAIARPPNASGTRRRMPTMSFRTSSRRSQS